MAVPVASRCLRSAAAGVELLFVRAHGNGSYCLRGATAALRLRSICGRRLVCGLWWRVFVEGHSILAESTAGIGRRRWA